jgi:hypothetical protein
MPVIQCVAFDTMPVIYNSTHTAKAVSLTFPSSICNFKCILLDPVTTISKKCCHPVIFIGITERKENFTELGKIISGS